MNYNLLIQLIFKRKGAILSPPLEPTSLRNNTTLLRQKSQKSIRARSNSLQCQVLAGGTKIFMRTSKFVSLELEAGACSKAVRLTVRAQTFP